MSAAVIQFHDNHVRRHKVLEGGWYWSRFELREHVNRQSPLDFSNPFSRRAIKDTRPERDGERLRTRGQLSKIHQDACVMRVIRRDQLSVNFVVEFGQTALTTSGKQEQKQSFPGSFVLQPVRSAHGGLNQYFDVIYSVSDYP